MAGKGDNRRPTDEQADKDWYDKVKWGSEGTVADSIEMCPHCGHYCTGKTVYCTKGI